MRILPTTISLTSCAIALSFIVIFFIVFLSAFAMSIVTGVNSQRYNLNHYVEATASVLDCKITLERTRSNTKYYYITVNLEYIANNRLINTWTDDKCIESRSMGEKYYADLDKNNTKIIYRKTNTHEAVILPVTEKIPFLWKGWVVIGSTLVGSILCILVCCCISFSTFVLEKQADSNV